MNKCRICGRVISSEYTLCFKCAREVVDRGEAMWKEAVEGLSKKTLQELRDKCDELAKEINSSKKEKIDIPIGEFYESVQLKPTKWIIKPDFMDDVINICPTCGKEFSMPDGTSVAHYYKYCPFCGDKMEE